MYELCRLGRHRPISKDLRNGIIRASKKAAARLVDEPVDEWFTSIGKEEIQFVKVRLLGNVRNGQNGAVP